MRLRLVRITTRKKIEPSWPYCRVEPFLALLQKAAERPQRNPPPIRNIFEQFRGQQVERRNYLWNWNWDENIPFAQDEEFIRATWEMLPMYFYFSRKEDRTFKSRMFD